MSSFLILLFAISLFSACTSGSVIVKRQVQAKAEGSTSIEGKGKMTFGGKFDVSSNSQGNVPSTLITSEGQAETSEAAADRDLSVFLAGLSQNEVSGQTDSQGANAFAFISGLIPTELEDPSPKAAAVAEADLVNSRVSGSIAVAGGIP